MLRQFAFRDWARYSERHGMPIIKAHVPMVGAEADKASFTGALQSMGNEAVVRLPMGIDGQDYDIELLEATANTWQGFQALITKCDTAITLTLQWQNLTTEVKEGSQAAARIHADVKQTAVEFDDRTLSADVGTQIASVWTAWNFGAGRPVPVTRHDTSVTEDHEAAAKVLESLSRSVTALTAAGVQVDAQALAAEYGVALPILEKASDKPPVFGYHLQAGVLTRDEVRTRLGEPSIGGPEGAEYIGAAGAPTEVIP
jgi:phage gp29-like protein